MPNFFLIASSKYHWFSIKLIVIGLLTAFLEPNAYLYAQANQDQAEQLRLASGKGDLEEVKKLIASKVDVNQLSKYGVSALALACDHGHEPIVKLLIDSGATPNTKDTFYRVSPLGWAVSKKRTNIVKLLVEAGAEDIDNGLSWAVSSRDLATAKVLLEARKATEAGLE